MSKLMSQSAFAALAVALGLTALVPTMSQAAETIKVGAFLSVTGSVTMAVVRLVAVAAA